MPHCTLEYTSNIKDTVNHDDFFKKLHTEIVSCNDFSLDQIKSRAVEHSNFYIGDGSPNNAFVYLQISILSGRNEILKQELSKKALTLLEEFFPTSRKELNCSVTVEIRDMDRASHSRADKINPETVTAS